VQVSRFSFLRVSDLLSARGALSRAVTIIYEEAETDAEGRYSFGDAMRSSYWFRWLRNLA